MLSSQQFIQTAREIFDPVAFDYATQSLYNVQDFSTRQSISVHNQILYDLDRGVINQATADARLNTLANTNNLEQIEDLLYRNAYVQNHTLSIQGGSDKHSFYGSMAYTDNQSSSPGELDNTYKLNLRQDFKMGKRFNFSLNTDLTNRVTEAKRAIKADNSYIPYALFQDANGNNLAHNEQRFFSNEQRADLENSSGINLDYIPLDEVNRGFTNSNGLSARLTAGISIDLFKGLKYEGTYGYFQENNKRESFDAEDSYQVRADRVFFALPGANPGDSPTFLLPRQGGYYQTSNGFVKNWTLRNQLSYDGNFNDGLHKVTAIAGYESQEQQFNTKSTYTRGYDIRAQTAPFLNYELLAGGVRGTLVSNSSSGRSRISSFSNLPLQEVELLSRFTSLYANAAYTFNNKYTISGSFRADESNNFGIDKSAQNRPVWSAGLKWNISRENFMANINWIDNLSLRGTLGITGNAPLPGGAASFDVLRTQIAGIVSHKANTLVNEITSAANEKLTWESTRTLNMGLDFGIFNNRVRGSFDYYESKTDNLLDDVIVNILTGFERIPGNLGSLENKGIEVSLQSLNIDGAFSWRTGITLTHNKSKLTKLTTSSSDSFNRFTEVFLTGYPRVGYDPLSVFAFDFVGLNNEGNAEARLADGTITTASADAIGDDLLHMGSYQPKWSGGFTNSFSYKGLTLTANMVYNLGHVMAVDTQKNFFGELLEISNNVHPDFFNRWQQPGDEANTNVPAYTTASRPGRNIYNYANIHVTSASYIKLRDISLSYELPDAIIQKINASRVSFRLMLNNVMLWKANDKGIDPEFHDALRGTRSTPFNQNSVTFGMHLTF